MREKNLDYCTSLQYFIAIIVKTQVTDIQDEFSNAYRLTRKSSLQPLGVLEPDEEVFLLLVLLHIYNAHL